VDWRFSWRWMGVRLSWLCASVLSLTTACFSDPGTGDGQSRRRRYQWIQSLHYDGLKQRRTGEDDKGFSIPASTLSGPPTLTKSIAMPFCHVTHLVIIPASNRKPCGHAALFKNRYIGLFSRVTMSYRTIYRVTPYRTTSSPTKHGPAKDTNEDFLTFNSCAFHPLFTSMKVPGSHAALPFT